MDIRRYKLKSLREQISFVLQETLLFHTSVWENIAYGKPDASPDQIIRAAKQANAHEFIVQLSEGYGTMVGERGVTLSGGQRQRIAIARAIVRNTPILVLDEPTTGLDSSSEQAVIEALERLMKGKTCIVVAHHLSTIRHADVIFVVKESELVEKGNARPIAGRWWTICGAVQNSDLRRRREIDRADCRKMRLLSFHAALRIILPKKPEATFGKLKHELRC